MSESYVCLYTSPEHVSEVTQITIDDNSVPKYETVLRWCEQIERRIIERRLGNHSAIASYIDVPYAEEPTDTYQIYYEASTDKLSLVYPRGGILVPLGAVKSPIISITKLWKNDESFDDAPVWEALVEWDGSTADSDYMLLKSGLKDSGYALWFYEDLPEFGPNRLRLKYYYGYNIHTKILGDWCSLKVGIKILLARMGTNKSSGLGMLEGDELGVFMSTNYRERIAEMRAQVDEIEAMYFPTRETSDTLAMEIF